MLDNLTTVSVILSFGFPAMPWLLGARWAARGIWISTGCVLVIVACFPVLFSEACVAYNCGQGALAIFVLGPIWFGSALLTVASAALAHRKFKRQFPHGPRSA
jgi:hypothetical protein